MLINTPELLEQVKPLLLACTDPVVDTETTGLSIFGSAERPRDKVIGIAVDDGTNAYYFPFRHLQGVNLPAECMGFFRKYLSDPNRTYGGWNYGYDEHMMYFDGIDFAPNFEDAMLAAHLLNENEPNFKLKDISDRYSIGDGSLQESILEDKVFEECQRLGLECSRSPRAANNTKSMMYVLPPEDVEPYACDDVRLTRQWLAICKEALEANGLFTIWKQVNYYSYIVTLMEHRGMHVDTDIIRKYQAEAESHSKDALARLHAKAGFELNPNSSKKVCEFLGTQSSAAERLVELIDAGGEPAEKAKLVQEARGWLSVDSRYYTPYLAAMDADSTLHCSLNLIGTYTGRLSSSGAVCVYDIDNIHMDTAATVTNTMPVGPYRGLGCPESEFGMECMMNELADELGMSAVEVRAKNFIKNGGENGYGEKITSIGVEKCLRACAEAIDLDTPSVQDGSVWKRGKGCAVGGKQNTPLGRAEAVVRYYSDSSVEVLISCDENGMGAMTVMAQIAASVLELPIEKIKVIKGDTQLTPFDNYSASSRTTYTTGNAVKIAAEEVKDKLQEAAAREVGVHKSKVAIHGDKAVIVTIHQFVG